MTDLSYKIFLVFFTDDILCILTQAPMSKSLPASQSVNVRSRAPQRKFAYGNVSKQSATGRTSSQAKGLVRQRLHPGMLSSQDRATSHYGAVTGLKVTDDGMYLLSAG